MAAPEYMNDLRKSSQLGFGVYSWLQLVDLVSRTSHYRLKKDTNNQELKVLINTRSMFTCTSLYEMFKHMLNIICNNTTMQTTYLLQYVYIYLCHTCMH